MSVHSPLGVLGPVASADVTQIASLIAAVIAAAAGLINMRLAVLRERPSLKVFAREWRTGPEGSEHYLEVLVTNVGHRTITVRSMGLQLRNDKRTWRDEDGRASPELPAKLEDGEIVTMIWLRDELGRDFYEQNARVVGCFALESRGHEVTGGAPRVDG
jgi:hypothetical protein